MSQGFARHNLRVAISLAMMLLVQAFVFGWSTGAMAHGPSLDQFGNPLCITGQEHAAPGQDHAATLNCCAMGCTPAAAWNAGPADAGSTFLRDVPRHVAPTAAPTDHAPSRAAPGPLGARAPPAALA